MIWIGGMPNGKTNGSENEEEAGKDHSRRWKDTYQTFLDTKQLAMDKMLDSLFLKEVFKEQNLDQTEGELVVW